MNEYFESWCVIKEFPNYNVNKLGDIFSCSSKKFIKQHISNTGYLRVFLYKDGKSQVRSVHRLMAINYLKNPNNKPQVNHIDGNKLNNNIDNLEWISGSNNIKHAYENNLRYLPIGERNSQNKLSTKQIKEIKIKLKNYKYGLGSKIAREYGVCQQTISDIKCGKIWSHIL